VVVFLALAREVVREALMEVAVVAAQMLAKDIRHQVLARQV
jgi:hypothetical protein